MHLLLAVVWLVACGDDATRTPGSYEPTGPVVVTVDGQPIHADAVELALTRLAPAQREALLSAGQLQPMVEQMALGEALYHRALDQGLHQDPDVRARLAMAERDALAQALVDRVVDAALTEEKLRQAYEERQVQFAQPTANVEIILVEDQTTAQQVWARLEAGAPFAELAREHSLDRSTGEEGGSLGWVVRGQLAEPVDQAVFADKGTGPIEPMEVGERWFLANVRERRDVVPFEEVREQLEGVVEQEAMRSYLEQVEREATIEWQVEPETLTSAFSGEIPPTGAP